jgi:hypothetical protein
MESVEDPVELSVKLINALNEAIQSHFNEKPLKSNFLFLKFVIMTSKLQQVINREKYNFNVTQIRLQSLTDIQKLAFFLNLHNLLIFHSQIVFGIPSNSSDRKKLVAKSYQIGNYDLTLNQVLSALRGRKIG